MQEEVDFEEVGRLSCVTMEPLQLKFQVDVLMARQLFHTHVLGRKKQETIIRWLSRWKGRVLNLDSKKL